MSDYTVVIHEAEEGGYWAEVPALPGCFAQGETVEETLGDSRKAIASHLRVLKREGRRIPRDHAVLLGRVGIASVLRAG